MRQQTKKEEFLTSVKNVISSFEYKSAFEAGYNAIFSILNGDDFEWVKSTLKTVRDHLTPENGYNAQSGWNKTHDALNFEMGFMVGTHSAITKYCVSNNLLDYSVEKTIKAIITLETKGAMSVCKLMWTNDTNDDRYNYNSHIANLINQIKNNNDFILSLVKKFYINSFNHQ